MALRVTQQTVDVLAEGSAGKLRVTQHYVEAIGQSGSYQTVSQSLGITDSATETDVGSGTTFNKSVTDTLGITDAATEVANRPVSASDTIAFSSTGSTVDDHLVSGSNALGISDSAVQNTVRVPSVTDTLSITDSAFEGDEKSVSASDTLALTDLAARTIDLSASSDLSTLSDSATPVADRPASASSTMALTDVAADVDVHTVSGSNALGITDSASAVGDHNLSAASTLTLTDSVTRPGIEVSVTDDLSILTDSVTQAGLTFASVTDTLSITHIASPGIIYVSVVDAMSLVDSPYAGRNISIAASNAITLTQSDVPGIYLALGSDTLVLVQLADGDIAGFPARSVTNLLGITDLGVGAVHDFGRQIFDTLTLTQSVAAAQPRYVTAADILSLSDSPGEHQGIANLSIADPMDLKDFVSRIQFGSATSTLTLTQQAYRRFFASDVITLVGSASGSVAKPMSDLLTLTDTVQKIFVFVRPMADSLGITDSAAAYLDQHGILCQYHPFIGAGPGPTIAATMPTLGSATLTLTYPFVSPTTAVVLRNPQFGNVDRLSFDRINRETRGGTLIMFALSKWPKQQTMNVTVTALKRSQKDALLDLLNLSVGQDIGLLDHENRQWRGIVLTPDAVVNNDSRGGYTVTFEFEGSLQ